MPSSSKALEQLLYVVTARGVLSWKDWKDACRSLSARLDFNGLSPAGAARTLDELGHLEIASEDGTARVMAAPAALVRLPKAGVSIGVVTGGRSPQTSRRIATAAAECGARFTAQPYSNARPETPPVLYVEAEDTVALAAVAALAEIPLADAPAAWTLAHAAGSIEAYLAALPWRHAPEPELEGREFNVATGRYGPVQRAAAGMRLIQYYPRVHSPFWELRDGERAARTDRDWGIYVCLSRDERDHLIHDRDLNALAVPIGTPLPRPIGRAFGLCCGEAPEMITIADREWPTMASTHFQLYRNVPRNIADLLLAKLGQSALPLHISPHSSA